MVDSLLLEKQIWRNEGNSSRQVDKFLGGGAEGKEFPAPLKKRKRRPKKIRVVKARYEAVDSLSVRTGRSGATGVEVQDKQG